MQRKLAELERQVTQAAARTSEVRQKRRALAADITTCTREKLSPFSVLVSSTLFSVAGVCIAQIC